MSPRKPTTDALGQQVNPEQLYTPISSFIRGHRVFNAGLIELRGDDPAVTLVPSLWVRTDATSVEKEAARKAHNARRMTENMPPQQPPGPYEPRIAEPKPLPAYERRAIAIDTFSKGDVFVRKGAAHDIGDRIVRLAPQMFRDLDGKPVVPDNGPA